MFLAYCASSTDQVAPNLSFTNAWFERRNEVEGAEDQRKMEPGFAADQQKEMGSTFPAASQREIESEFGKYSIEERANME